MNDQDEILASIVASDPAPTKREPVKLSIEYLIRLSDDEVEALIKTPKHETVLSGVVYKHGADNVTVCGESASLYFHLECVPDHATRLAVIMSAVEEHLSEITGRKAEAEPLWGMF